MGDKGKGKDKGTTLKPAKVRMSGLRPPEPRQQLDAFKTPR